MGLVLGNKGVVVVLGNKGWVVVLGNKGVGSSIR